MGWRLRRSVGDGPIPARALEQGRQGCMNRDGGDRLDVTLYSWLMLLCQKGARTPPRVSVTLLMVHKNCTNPHKKIYSTGWYIPMFFVDTGTLLGALRYSISSARLAQQFHHYGNLGIRIIRHMRLDRALRETTW